MRPSSNQQKAQAPTAYQSWMQPDIARVLLVGMLFAGILLIITSFLAELTLVRSGDISIYAGYAHHIVHGQLPYRSLVLEYPPGVLPFILLPLMFGDYTTGYVVLTTLATGLLLGYLFRRLGLKSFLFFLLPILPLLQFLFYNLDIFAAIALYGAVWCVQKQRLSWSAVLLAISTLIKAYPAICLVGLIWCIPLNKRWRYLGVFFGSLTIVLLPLLIWAPSGSWHAITYHSGRPVEFESTAAAVGYIMHLFGGATQMIISHKSWGLLFSGSTTVGTISDLCLLGGTLAIGWLGWQKRLQAKPVSLSILLLLNFVLFFKIASPQFLIPTLLLLPLALTELQTQWHSLVLYCFLVSVTVFAQFVLLFDTHGSNAPLTVVIAVLRVAFLVAAMGYLARILYRTQDRQGAL
jgi:hypothetical protein